MPTPCQPLDPNRPGYPERVLRFSGGISALVEIRDGGHVLHLASLDGITRTSVALNRADALGLADILGKAAMWSVR